MDILTHIVSGVATGSVVAAFANPKKIRMKRILAAGTMGGAFPDIDAISLWSKFDATIGKWFGLAHKGSEIYYGNFWYSHHAFFHSIAAAVAVGFILGCLTYLYHCIRWKEQKDSLYQFFTINISVFLAFVLGCMAHVAGDLPTPASVWGGVQLFWPYAGYLGGSGKIWWWNNYDIFLIIFAGALLNMMIITVAKHFHVRSGIFTLLITLLVIAGVWRQAATRTTDYAYTGHTRQSQLLERKSKEEQQRILGPKVYSTMEKVDQWLPFNF